MYMMKLMVAGMWGVLASLGLWQHKPLKQRSQDGQGIEGTVFVASGNQMPAPGRPRPVPRGIQTTVFIYALTNIRQVTRVGQSAYYSAVPTKLIHAVETDSLGHFSVSLPVGRYSVFTKKGGLFYASIFDSENNIAPVEVVEGKMSRADCTIEGERKPVY